MIVVLKRGTIILLAGVLGLSLAHAATPEETSGQLQAVQQGLESANKKVSEISATVANALLAQDDISNKLVTLAKTMADQEAALATSAGKLKDLETQSVILASTLASRQDELSVLLAGLQRLQQNPPPALIVEPDNVLQAMRGAMMFGAVVPGIRDQAHDLKDKLDELQAIRDETQSIRDKRQKEVQAVHQSQTELNALLLAKKTLAVTAQNDLDAEKQNAAALAEKANSLKQLLADLEKARIETEQKKTAEAKAAADRLEALRHPPVPLSASKGKLAYPVAGTILKRYGQDNGLGSTLDGLAIATHANVNVLSPVYGKVEFAGPFRSYGQLLILNAGEGYLVLLAGMKQISANIGQSVKAGEPVGVMGDGPSTFALLGEEKDRTSPLIYVEFRKDNAPVDSTPWWAESRKEAMR